MISTCINGSISIGNSMGPPSLGATIIKPGASSAGKNRILTVDKQGALVHTYTLHKHIHIHTRIRIHIHIFMLSAGGVSGGQLIGDKKRCIKVRLL